MKRVLYFLTFAAIIFASSCEIITDSPYDFVPDQPDQTGNLLIINNSNEQLVLYKDQEVVKMIPASATDYLVYIPNEGEGTVQLDLYVWNDVAGDVDNPTPSEAFKRWLVPLSSSDAVESRATWHVGGASQYTDVATLNLSYFGGTDNFVDVYLNGRTGGKIASLKPGDQYKKVGVDYGNYTLHYLYWFSDQNDANAFEELGWIEEQLINGEEKDIWLILNENRKDVTMVIPHMGSAASQGTKYAGVEIANYSGEPVQVFVGDKLIEAVCYLEEGNTKNLSTMDVNGVYTFFLPITEEGATEKSFRLKAQTLTTVQTVETIDITLTADDVVKWVIDGEDDLAPEEEDTAE
jgi:hypothetical protein